MLYLRQTHNEASPKAISGRTSYLRVRLEFLRYPQVIPTFFNRYGFGPPVCFTTPSTCSWVGHPVSGLQRQTLRALHTRFPFGSGPPVLNLACRHNSSDRSTKSTPSSLNALRLLVNTGFQVLFHSLLRVLFTFPSQYCFTIGYHRVFRLGGWSPRLPTEFLVFHGTLVLLASTCLRLPDSYRLWARLSMRSFCSACRITFCSPQPRWTEVHRFGLCRVRSPLLTASRLISFPEGT